jgi:uncharacterized protein (TIGR01777 family)
MENTQKILITGGTGLIGQHLSKMLSLKGYKVQHLSRTENLNATFPAYGWDLSAMTMNEKALEGVDTIIHLAGAGIADKKWSAQRKKILEESRTKSSQLLHDSIQKIPNKVATFVACSAIGYYGNRGDEKLVEDSPPGTDFMADICVKWENSTAAIKKLGIRVPTIRVGVVLSTQGGALPEMTKTAPLRTLGHFGNRYMSWIHLDDICRIFVEAVENPSLTGYYNGTAPTPITSKALINAIEKAYGKTMLKAPAPAIGIRMAFGEMADVVLSSTRVLPANLEKTAFEFKYSTAVDALKDLFERKI